MNFKKTFNALWRSLTGGALLLLFTAGSSAFALEPLEPPVPQTILPVHNYTRLDPNQNWLEPSATEKLPIGARVAHVDPAALIAGAVVADDLQLANPFYWTVQKLTNRTYAIFVGFYAFTLYEGNHGLLLIDCGGHFGPPEIDSLLAAIQSISNKPLKALVYSHAHADHVGNSLVLKQMFPNMKIIASRWAAEDIEEYNYPIAYPDHIVYLRNGHFIFDNKIFRLTTPVKQGHTGSDSYIITPDRVMHVVDAFHPMRLSMPDVSLSTHIDGFVKLIRHLSGEANNYDYINVGHAQIAYQSDVETALDFWQDAFQAWSDVMSQEIPMAVGHYITPQDMNAGVWYRNFLDDASLRMWERMKGDWGHVRHFEFARDHMEELNKSQFINHVNATDPNTYFDLPDLSPIPPPWPHN